MLTYYIIVCCCEKINPHENIVIPTIVNFIKVTILKFIYRYFLILKDSENLIIKKIHKSVKYHR